MSAARTHRVTVSGRSFVCTEDISILEGMRRVGAAGLRVGCRRGGCGVCKARVVSGDVDLEVMSRAHVTAEEEADGWVLTCRAHARSEVVLEPDSRPQAAVVFGVGGPDAAQ